MIKGHPVDGLPDIFFDGFVSFGVDARGDVPPHAVDIGVDQIPTLIGVHICPDAFKGNHRVCPPDNV